MTAATTPDVESASAAPKPQITELTPGDLPAISKLHDRVFGPGRFARTAYRIREGAPAVSPACCKLMLGDTLIGAVQMTAITVGGQDNGMLLGPLAVDTEHTNEGHGQALIAAAIAAADALGTGYIILVGDLPYYERAGFMRVPLGQITLPGPVDANRLLIRLLDKDVAIPKGLLRAIPASG